MVPDSQAATDEEVRSDGSREVGLASVSLSHRNKVRLLGLALFVAFVLLLEAVAVAELLPTTQFVSPVVMVETLVTIVSTGELYPHFMGTVMRVGAAFGAASLFGIPIGWALWRNDTLFRILNPYLIVLYAMPIFVFYPLLIIIVGLGSLPIILIAFVMSITVVVISTADGLDNIPEIFFDVGRSLNLSTFQSVTRIQLPAAVPYIFTGLKLGFIYAFIGVIASEFILSNSGLGYYVSLQYQRFNTAKMYAGVIAIIILSVATNAVLVRIEDYLYERGVRR